MTVRAQDIVEEALSWVGTPFAHQQRIKGAGVDCVNFVAEVARATGATPDVDFERNYRRRADGSQMMGEILRYLKSVESFDDARPGDVIALCDERLARPDVVTHLAFFTGAEPYPKMVHASERGVRHHRINIHFRNRIHSVWRVPNLVY
jgi:cell wall-associated NlpC family hydrolase